jgi:NAD(P)-dependent dehydrogenase (short-subunit alcohol dehydrogenase family)
MTTTESALDDMLNLHGYSIVVTGAAQGFGRAIARRLFEAGASVHLVDRNLAAVAAAASELSAAASTRRGSGTATGHELDITDEVLVARFFDEVMVHNGPKALVNNAGVFSNVLLDAMSIAEFERILRVNVTGTYLMSQQFVSRLAVGDLASIVNIASVDAVQPSAPGLSHYTTSKHAVAGITKTLAMELARRGIRVNAVCPGASMTEGALSLIAEGADEGIDVADQWSGIATRTPLGRLISPDDVARAALFLISPMASSITGVLLPVDAGILVQPLEGYVEGPDEH